jgi:hypothetical protein
MKPEIDTVGGTAAGETATPSVTGIPERPTGTAPARSSRWSGRLRPGSRWRFARHLLEMIAAMMVGMVIFGATVGALGDPPGYSNPLVEYGFMGASMSGAMVAWMRFREHAWSGCLEMTAAMLVPMFAVVMPFGLGVVGETSGHALMMLAHVAMIGGMVVLMIYRRDRYT